MNRTKPENMIPFDALLSYNSELDTSDVLKTINDDLFDDLLSFDTVTDLARKQFENVASGQSNDPLLCTIPELQLDVNDFTVEFQYDACEQLACDLNTLSYPDIPVAIPDIPVAIPDIPVVSNTNSDSADEQRKAQEWPKFECSTGFPITIEELEEDINRIYDRNLRVTEKSFYFLDRDPFTDDWLLELDVDKTDQINIEKTNIEKVNMENVKIEQDPKSSTMAPVNAKSSEKPNLKCNLCPFKARSAAGLTEHLKMHSVTRVKCNNCRCITTKTYYLRRHNPYEHGEAFCCQICGFMTHSSSRIKTHMRKEH